ncbi:hypothetical protein SDC9_15214 [bioreactor metagenome]|uniref:Uncharacterized protein n=1 Tax=bioreactor metagenome TaxID=1076179 RepID=A0A644TS45_9ZZZZ
MGSNYMREILGEGGIGKRYVEYWLIETLQKGMTTQYADVSD